MRFENNIALDDGKIKQIFFDLESINRTFEFRIDGVPIYSLLRFPLEIYYRKGRVIQANRFREFIVFAKKKLKKSLQNAIRHEPVILKIDIPKYDFPPSDFLFVSTSNWEKRAGESIELIDIINYFRENGELIHFVQPDYEPDIIVKQSYHDLFTKIPTYSYYMNNKWSNELKRFLGFISGIWNRNLLKSFDSFYMQLSDILVRAQYLAAIIHASKTRNVFARSIYTEPWVPYACKLSGAKCIEIQHGVMCPDNIYYQSQLNPDIQKDLLLFPDFILTLGEEWTQILIDQKGNFTRENTFTLGSWEGGHFTRRKEQNSFIILVALQHGVFSLNDFLISFLNEYGEECKKQGIVVAIRPHPNALIETRKIFRKYVSGSVKLIDPAESHFLRNLEEADMVLSGSSMCLYESASFGIPAVSIAKFRGVTLAKGIEFVEDIGGFFDLALDIKQKKVFFPAISYLSPFDYKVLDHFLN